MPKYKKIFKAGRRIEIIKKLNKSNFKEIIALDQKKNSRQEVECELLFTIINRLTSFMNHLFSSRFYVMLFIWSLLDTSLYVQDNCLNHTPVFASLWCTLWFFSVSSCLLCSFSLFPLLFLFVLDCLNYEWVWNEEMEILCFLKRIRNFVLQVH